MPIEVRSVAVIGAGGVGLRLAGLFAGAGFETVLEDILPSNLRKAAEVLRGNEHGADARLRFASSVEDAVRAVDLIVDCVPDELESKLEIFSLLDRMAPPRAILLTPTTTLSIADLASCTYRAERCLAAELPGAEGSSEKLLRLTATSLTSTEVKDAVAEFWEAVGYQVEWKLDAAEASVSAGTLF